MSVSIIDLVKEEVRLEVTGDRYYQNGPYAFVLRGPPMTDSIGPLGYTVFPLPVNPTDLSYAMPFSCEITPLQEGGVVAEEAGICIGELVIEGSTGFKPRLAQDTSFGPGGGDFTGLLGHGWAGPEAISGQLAFWRLANRCFDAYSSLKKDPRYAHKTTMEYHSLKDELHLQIVPREFSLRRSAGRERVSYRYSIRAAVVGAAGRLFLVSPDKGILDKIKDTISTIRAGMAAIAATVDDLTAALDSIRRTVSSVVSILTDVGTIMDSFTALVDGTKKFLDIPKETLGNVARLCEDVAEVVATTTGWPADVQQSFLDISDQLDALSVASTDLFTTSWQEQARRYERLSRMRFPTVGSKQFTLDSQQVTVYPIETVFSGEKPGDLRRAATVISLGERLPSHGYNGFAEYVVGQGDSLQSLAAKHLGDASKWMELAVINDLKAPYITSVKLPQTLRVGDKISIPILGKEPPADTITTGDKITGASQSDKFLGEDFKFVPIPAGLDSLGEPIAAGSYGWQIDEAGGATDVLKISGIPNLGQALEMRFRTEQGANILYPTIGLPRLIGVAAFGSKIADARHQARLQILADKRIERLARFAFSVVNDALILEADVQPSGYSTTRTIARTLT